jgi:2-polyprenyl-6-methoxyphenol hydroxylase-like FAD-dependent oxidoreductase
MPNPIPDVETHGITITDQVGNVLLAPSLKPYKDVYEMAKISHGMSTIVTYRDRLRDVLLEGVPVQWNKKCIKYKETQEGVLVYFEDGSEEFCNILVGADGINSPSKLFK